MELDAIPPAPKWPNPVGSIFTTRQQQEAERLRQESERQQRQHQEALERELARTQDELEAMQSLLEDLPALFETKFQQRLEPLLQQQQRLLEDNALLRQQLLQLQPSPEPAKLRLLPPRQQDRSQLREGLRHAFGFRRAA